MSEQRAYPGTTTGCLARWVFEWIAYAAENPGAQYPGVQIEMIRAVAPVVEELDRRDSDWPHLRDEGYGAARRMPPPQALGPPPKDYEWAASRRFGAG